MVNEQHLLILLKLWKRNIEERGTHWNASQWLDHVIKEINIMPKIGEWIRCSERLPNQNDNNINDSTLSIPVLVQYKDITTEPEVLHYNTFTKKFCYDQIDVTSNVIAWMPLPCLCNVNI